MFFIFFQVEWISQTWSFRLRGKIDQIESWNITFEIFRVANLLFLKKRVWQSLIDHFRHHALLARILPSMLRENIPSLLCIVHIVRDLCRGVLCGHAILVQTFTVEKPKACLTLVCPRSKCDQSSTCASGCCTHHGCHHISHGCAL